MKRNDTYLSPGLITPPASFDFDSGDDYCEECGQTPCNCDVEEGFDGILGEG